MRSLEPFITKDLQKKFVLISGPRQVGKTTLAQSLLHKQGGRYYNWDLAEDRERILGKEFIREGLVVLDEVHKYERWKGFIKGLYDKYHESLKILITGSARMDVYRRGSDSLFGRYYHHLLHPLSLGEVFRPEVISLPDVNRIGEEAGEGAGEILETLWTFGGFPEPFYRANMEEHRRWSIQRRELLVRQEIRDLTQIHMLNLVEHLMMLLPQKVASILSVNSIREDLQVAYPTVRQWLDAFARLYISYELQPYTTKVVRSLHKASKLYLWDWSQVTDEGARFENMIASHLLKAVGLWRDLGYGDFELFFLRDRERREIDFCVTKDRKPWMLVETKLAEEGITDPLVFFTNKFSAPAFQVLKKSGVDRRRGMIRVISAERFLASLP